MNHFYNRQRAPVLTALFFVMHLAMFSRIHAFNARLANPWDHSRIYIRQSAFETHRDNRLELAFTSKLNLNEEHNDEINHDLKETKETKDNHLPESLQIKTNAIITQGSIHSSSMPLDQGVDVIVPLPKIRENLGALFRLTRPINFPSIVLLHMLGVYLAMNATGHLDVYWYILLQRVEMWLTLAALMLTSATSMIVNDYYDAKLGRDTDPHKVLVNGELPLLLAKRFTSYLYAAALVCLACLPGIPTRLSVVTGLSLTFLYTQHLKPITWLKNSVCASLIALSPLTSGSAAIHIISDQAFPLLASKAPDLWRLVAVLFLGLMGREITMDCTDVENDQRSQVRTVPVKYGCRFASRVALVGALSASTLTLTGPIVQYVSGQFSSSTTLRRLGFAVIGSALQINNAWKVASFEGKNSDVSNRAVDQGLLIILFVLSSFI